MSEGDDLQLTDEKVEELENVLRLVKRATPFLIAVALLLVVTLALTSFGFVRANQDDAAIRALSREAAANQQQAKDAQRFLSDFLNEENYVCQISGAYAVHAGLPTPKPGECAVKLPTPRPSATPAPTATAAPPRSTAPAPRTATPSTPARAAPPAESHPTPHASPKPTATPLIMLPSLPPLPLFSLPPLSRGGVAKSKRHCGLLDGIIAELHGRRC